MNEFTKRPKVWVIIVTFNGSKWIERCLESLKNSSFPITTFVIDNGSTDGTISIIQAQFPQTILIQNFQNSGFGQANNKGIQEAIKNEADFVFLMNQDAWIATDTIEILVSTSLQYPQYGILSPIHLNGKGNELDFGFSTYSSFCSLQELTSHCENEKIVDVPFVNAAFWLIPTSIIKNVGGFDPLFFYCGEDINLAQRIKYNHRNIGFIPTAKAYHDRENRSLSHKKQRDLFIIYHLTEALNILQSPFLAFLNGYVALWKRTIIALISFQWNDFTCYLVASIQFLLQTNTINRHRKLSKTKGKNYLTNN